MAQWRERRAARRVKPGDGRPLKPFRWWQTLSRALFTLRLRDDDGRHQVYAVDVRHWGNSSTGDVEAHLYLDGRQHAVSKVPAAFPVPGGSVEVAVSAFGLKRCHYVAADGSDHQLEPDPSTAEGRRAHLERAHPALSRRIGHLSLLVLVVGLAVLVPQVVAPLSQIPPVAQHLGTVASPVDVPAWANAVITVLAVAASTERALRLRYSALLDGGVG